MTEKYLSKPPFKYLFDIFVETSKVMLNGEKKIKYDIF